MTTTGAHASRIEDRITELPVTVIARSKVRGQSPFAPIGNFGIAERQRCRDIDRVVTLQVFCMLLAAGCWIKVAQLSSPSGKSDRHRPCVAIWLGVVIRVTTMRSRSRLGSPLGGGEHVLSEPGVPNAGFGQARRSGVKSGNCFTPRAKHVLHWMK